MITLDLKKTLDLHRLMTEQTGGDPGLRDAALLEGALAAPFQTFDEQELYPSLEEKGARLCCSLIADHAFVDGNKRIGMFALLVFLALNDAPICPPVPEVARVGLAVAAGQMRYDEVLCWIRANR